MYLTKGKQKTSLYKDYEPRFPKYKDVENQAYVAYVVGNDVSNRMQATIRSAVKMIAQRFSKGVN